MDNSTQTVAFLKEIEGDDRIFLHITSRPENVLSGMKGYYRFGPGSAIVRFHSVEGEMWNRVFTFETEDGALVPYDVKTLEQRMKSGALEQIRYVTLPVDQIHANYMNILAHAAACMGATIEHESHLKRPNKKILARETARGTILLDVMTNPPQGRAGVKQLEEHIRDQIQFELAGVTMRQTISGQSKSEVRRHEKIAEQLQNDLRAHVTTTRSGINRSRERLAKALGVPFTPATDA